MEEKKGIVVKVDHVTKDYGKGRGNFDMSFNVHKGEAFGLVGENGAGKTTIIRQIMGFIKPTSGNILVYGLNAYKEAARIKSYVGYVPGEINFPDYRTGIEFLHAYANMVGVTDFTYSDTIIKRLQLDIRAYPRRMSKGMKQKTAIVTALMIQAPLIIMDEPTTGLDPLMRDEFLKIVLEEIKSDEANRIFEELTECIARGAFLKSILSWGTKSVIFCFEKNKNTHTGITKAIKS